MLFILYLSLSLSLSVSLSPSLSQTHAHMTEKAFEAGRMLKESCSSGTVVGRRAPLLVLASSFTSAGVLDALELQVQCHINRERDRDRERERGRKRGREGGRERD
jgi:hypothetical protein